MSASLARAVTALRFNALPSISPNGGGWHGTCCYPTMSNTTIGYEIGAEAIIAEARRQEAERARAAIHAAGPQTCGRFSYDPETGAVTGPAGYMRSEHYARRMAAITGGRDAVAGFGYAQHGDLINAVLVSLQTDYAAWEGMREFDRRLSA